MTQTPSPAQQHVFDFVKSYIKEHSYPPSQRDIATHFKHSQPAIREHLLALERKGYIQITGKARGIKVLKKK